MLSSILAMSMLAVPTEQIGADSEPLRMIEEYFVNQRSLGIDHPRMRELRQRIDDVTDGDFQCDLRKVQERFERLALNRASLLQSKGLTHPDVIENATRLSVISRLLAGQSASMLRDVSATRK